jgi:sec-independent protein translocase protein TatC
MKKFDTHLTELQYRLILGLIGTFIAVSVCLIKGDFFLKMITHPYLRATRTLGIIPKLQAIDPTESFLIYLKTSLLFGLIFSSPWIFYQLWAFISKGLYKKEKRLVYIFLPLCTLLFLSGTFLFLYVIAPIVMTFLISFDTGLDFVVSEFSLKSYISFIILLTLIFGLSFQFPIIILLLCKIGILTIASLSRSRKYVLLALFIFSAVVTPPDIVSQITLALPLYILFEATILVLFLLQKKKIA